MDVKRNEKGHPLPGQSLRGTSKGANARNLSRRLRAKLKAKYGDDRAYYDWLIDIAGSAAEKAADRIKAIQVLAERIDGKSVQAIELSGPGGSPLETETTVKNEPPSAERLAGIVRALAGAGALPVASSPGRSGGGADVPE